MKLFVLIVQSSVSYLFEMTINRANLATLRAFGYFTNVYLIVFYSAYLLS
jgi:hypothetical protein